MDTVNYKELKNKEVMYFSELLKELAGISSNLLASRLAELEKEQLIAKKVYGEKPSSKVEYSLTLLALELDDILNNLDRWVDKWKSSLKNRVS
jgi:DNA-binding HxlR family transcriptional regulator